MTTTPTTAWVLCREDVDGTCTPIRVFLDKPAVDLVVQIDRDSRPYELPLSVFEVPVGLVVTVVP